MFKFELSEQEANIVLQALAKAPYEVVAAVIAKLQQQGQEQLASKDEVADKETV